MFLGHLPFRTKKIRYDWLGKEGRLHDNLIAINDEKLGPYSVAEAQRLAALGTLRPTDWAWYEGLTDWIPLGQVPGFTPVRRAKRPMLVWVLCIPFFICTPFMFLWVVLTLLMASGAIPILESQRQFFESQSNFDRGVAIINDIMIAIWAVLLFLLKRQSLYVYLGILALSAISITYHLVAENTFTGLRVAGPVVIDIIMVLNLVTLATLYYNWHLFRKGVLR